MGSGQECRMVCNPAHGRGQFTESPCGDPDVLAGVGRGEFDVTYGLKSWAPLPASPFSKCVVFADAAS